MLRRAGAGLIGSDRAWAPGKVGRGQTFASIQSPQNARLIGRGLCSFTRPEKLSNRAGRARRALPKTSGQAPGGEAPAEPRSLAETARREARSPECGGGRSREGEPPAEPVRAAGTGPRRPRNRARSAGELPLERSPSARPLAGSPLWRGEPARPPCPTLATSTTRDIAPCPNRARPSAIDPGGHAGRNRVDWEWDRMDTRNQQSRVGGFFGHQVKSCPERRFTTEDTARPLAATKVVSGQ